MCYLYVATRFTVFWTDICSWFKLYLIDFQLIFKGKLHFCAWRAHFSCPRIVMARWDSWSSNFWQLGLFFENMGCQVIFFLLMSWWTSQVLPIPIMRITYKKYDYYQTFIYITFMTHDVFLIKGISPKRHLYSTPWYWSLSCVINGV